MNDTISVLQGGRTMPIVPHALKRHAGIARRGMHVEHHAVAAMEFPERELLQHNLFLYTGVAARAEIKSPEFSGMRWIRPGELWIMPQGSRHSVRFESAVEGVALAFEPDMLDMLVRSAGGRSSASIVQSLATCPPKLDLLMRALALESCTPSSSSHLGLECIATAIALALSESAGATAVTQEAGPRLGTKQLRAVQAYIEDQLDLPISLTGMAAVAGLSNFHFLRAFKGSLGTTPLRYVLDARMARARALIERDELSLTEIGIRVGFEDPSHFARAFRRAIGMAPSSFRDVVRKKQ